MKLFAEYFTTTYRHLANTLFSVVLLTFITSANAQENEEAANLLNGFHQAQIQSYFTINAFYNFSANDGDKALLSDVNDAINEVNSILNGLESYESVDYVKEDINAATEKWQLYKSTLNTIINDILDQGYADLRLMSDLALQNQEFASQLGAAYEKVERESGYKPDSLTSQSRTSALLMATMMTKYSARTTSNVSQIFQGSTTEKTIDVLALELDQHLQELLSNSSGEQKEVVSSVITKWDFIKGSYINYNEKNVNYVVNLYSKRIIDALESTSGL
ncbi:hypothetical protein [Alkalimarinus sediminis]|uniref:Type IV pili methyl-accepting chemotaxis transducer N-term n=1 Tax=Alkalimarinus sediminis TaxID=1632866 RepID=A0A9E8HJP9_9ALTE|nr:hypothetical protein [Alkalimarinus sediminis]UZW75915.1 hypothetical protein NNL22_04865 [Alkalimarinus sediminis]